MDFQKAYDFILDYYREHPNPFLTYHNLSHTLGVLEVVSRLSSLEDIRGESKIILETAALFHDAGILTRYRDHEEASVTLARSVLPGFGYPETSVQKISTLILKTKLPQTADNIAEMVLCDADLDYLGRDDFFIHCFELQLEWQLNGIKSTNLREWMEVQVRFLSDHQYFTKSAKLLRDELKTKHLSEIKKLLDIKM